MGRLGLKALIKQVRQKKVGGGLVFSIGARLLLARSFTLAFLQLLGWERTQSRDKHPIYVSRARPAILLYNRNCSPRKITNSYRIQQLDQIHSFAPMSQAEAQAKSEPFLIEFIRSGSQSSAIKQSKMSRQHRRRSGSCSGATHGLFKVDLRLASMDAFQVVLGIDFLRQVKDATHEFEERRNHNIQAFVSQLASDSELGPFPFHPPICSSTRLFKTGAGARQEATMPRYDLVRRFPRMHSNDCHWFDCTSYLRRLFHSKNQCLTTWTPCAVWDVKPPDLSESLTLASPRLWKRWSYLWISAIVRNECNLDLLHLESDEPNWGM